MAYHDNLTGLPNRALLSDRLERAMLASQRSERKLAVMFIDLDRFKTINDSLGHMTGDYAAQGSGRRLCRAVRASDTVARLGGDEFVVLVPGIRGADEAARVAEKIIEALTPAFPLDGRMCCTSRHRSASACIRTTAATSTTLMRHADAAMYHAKAQWPQQLPVLHADDEPGGGPAFRTGKQLAHGAGAATSSNCSTSRSSISPRAACTRWKCCCAGAVPADGLVLPDHFIPIMEENGLIVPVGEWVMRQACEQSMAWQRQGLQPVPLAVNLSPRQFMHRGLVAVDRRRAATKPASIRRCWNSRSPRRR